MTRLSALVYIVTMKDTTIKIPSNAYKIAKDLKIKTGMSIKAIVYHALLDFQEKKQIHEFKIVKR